MADAAPASKKPADTPFKQQKLKAWQPILTPKWVILTFLLVGALFLPIGIAVFIASSKITEVTTDYTSCAEKTNCNITVTIPNDMDPPIFVYYQLTNFYQNHRRYVQSRSDVQLRGSFLPSDQETNPVTMTGDNANSLLTDCTPSINYVDGANTYYYYPCGLVARSWFNDTFTLTPSNGVPLDMTTNPTWQDKTGLAWPSDINKKFKQASIPWMKQNCAKIGPTDPAAFNMTGFDYSLFNFTNPAGNFDCWHNVSDEKFIVWMRTAGLPDFKKLYARIDGGKLLAGTYNVFVNSNFPVTSFNGTKSFVLSTTAWIGGKNNFLGIAYLVVGSLCVLMGVIFLGKHLISPRTLGDQQYLVWKN